MKFISSLLLIMLLSITACLFLPWWSIAVVAFAVTALIPQPPLRSFFCGFTALFLGWGLLSFYISSANDHVLAHKISMVMISRDSPLILILATALIGAVVAGTAALAGSYVHPPRVKKEHTTRIQEQEQPVAKQGS